jgi:aspartyl-tRNA(Asn)/glutamyl-tRNA(Gln) amidotransferase subunit A
MPAAWCGIVGLRPSSDSFDLDGVVPRSRALDVVGPIVRTVEDCDYFLGTSFLPKSNQNARQQELPSIQIGWDPSLLGRVDVQVAKAFKHFMQQAEKQANISFVKQSWPDFPRATNCALTVLQMEFLQDFRKMCGDVELFADRLGKPVINELRHSASLDPSVLQNAYLELEEFRGAMSQMIGAVDMLALPLTPCGPVKESGLPEAAKPLRELSLPMGAAGLPILGMPLIFTKDQYDLSPASLAGVQLVGKKYQEHNLVSMVKTYLGAPK